MIEQKCLTCEKIFKVFPYQIKNGWGKFCSYKCFIKWNTGKNNPAWQGGKIKKICQTCGKEFNVISSRIKKGKVKFCSMECYGKWSSQNKRGENKHSWKGGEVKCVCKICGKEFYVPQTVIRRGFGKFCSKSCSIIWKNTHNGNKNTSIEIKMEQELLRRKIKFEKQKPIWKAKTIPDFFISPNICIYADGDYWHNLFHVKQRDFNQDFILKFYGYKVYRFRESEINKDVKKCVDKIK